MLAIPRDGGQPLLTSIILSTNDSIYDNIIEYIHDGVVCARRRERSKKNIR